MGGYQSWVAVLKLAHKFNIDHLGEMNRWKCTQSPHTERLSLFLSRDVNIWQLRSISCKRVESVCWTEGVSAGSQPMWGCNSLMKTMCVHAWGHLYVGVCICAYVKDEVHVSEYSFFLSFDIVVGFVIASRRCVCYCKSPIKCVGRHSRHPNICDPCIKQTRKATRARAFTQHFHTENNSRVCLKQNKCVAKCKGFFFVHLLEYILVPFYIKWTTN